MFLCCIHHIENMSKLFLCIWVRCRELKRADRVAFPLKGSNMEDEANGSVSVGLSYSIEIKDAYIPPWIIFSISATMGSEGRSFEARHVKSSDFNCPKCCS
ncbi:unnamed protein product, partial [Vitis vinifera]